MPLVTSTEMFKKAYNGGYAIGAFNVNNMEIIQGITEAAKEENAPLILQVSAGARKYANHTYLMKLCKLRKRLKVMNLVFMCEQLCHILERRQRIKVGDIVLVNIQLQQLRQFAQV